MRKGFLKVLAVIACVVFVNGCVQTPPRKSVVLRVMTYNIHHGEGTDGKIDLERIARLINENKIDIVALQEVDQYTQRTGKRDFPAELSALTGMKSVFGKNLDLEGGGYGNAILSRFPIKSTTNHHLPKIAPGEQRGMLTATIVTSAGPLLFASVHLDHRRPETDRLASVDTIQKILRPVIQPMIIAGDFNATPESETIKRMKSDNVFQDPWSRVGQGPGFTIPSENPRSRIDYLFFRRLEAKSATVIHSNASDHLPLIAEFRLSP